MGDKTWSFLKNIYADLILFLSRRWVCLDYFYEKKKNVCCVSTKQAWRHQPIFKEILILLVNCNFRHRIRTLKLLLPSVWSGISIWKPDNIRANQEKLIQAVERRLQTHRKACFGKKKKKKSSHNSSRGLFIHLPQCSSWLFLSFFRSLGSLMIPACLSSVYLTPSSALCGLPPVLAGAQSCTDHFILWDKPAFLSNPGEAALELQDWKPQTFGTLPQVIHVAVRALLHADSSFKPIKSQAEVHIPAQVMSLYIKHVCI